MLWTFGKSNRPAKTLLNVYKINKAIQNIVIDVYLFINKSAFLLISRKYHINKFKRVFIYIHLIYN